MSDGNSYPINAAEAFAHILDRELRKKRITNGQVSRRTGVHHRTIGGWRRGATFPMPGNFRNLLGFLKNYPDINVHEIEGAYLAASERVVNPPADEDEESIDQKAVEQVSAAFRFGIQHEKIDALPETPETLERSLAEELYIEFGRKLRELKERLSRSNADPYVGSVVDRLLGSLGESFEHVRPGVVLMHFRSIEAIVAGFDTEEGRQALFPDAIAMLNDIDLSGQDFLACFPNVRRIERARIAAGIEKDPAVLQQVRRQTAAIKAAAAESEIVASGAVKALRENEPDLKEAKDVELAADLVADEVLITRNFVSEALRAAWEAIRPDFVAGSKAAARMLPPLAVIALLTVVAGPVAGLAGILRGNIFKPVNSSIKSVQGVGTGRARKRSGAIGIASKDLDDAIKNICKRYGLAPNVVVKMLTTGELPKINDNLSRKELRGLIKHFATARAMIDRDESGKVMKESDYLSFFTPLPRHRGR